MLKKKKKKTQKEKYEVRNNQQEKKKKIQNKIKLNSIKIQLNSQFLFYLSGSYGPKYSTALIIESLMRCQTVDIVAEACVWITDDVELLLLVFVVFELFVVAPPAPDVVWFLFVLVVVNSSSESFPVPSCAF